MAQETNHETLDDLLKTIETQFQEEKKDWPKKRTKDSATAQKEGKPIDRSHREVSEPNLPRHEIHGFENEVLALKNFLLKKEGDEEFKTLAVVGKLGVGKTTLCQKIFNEEDVMKRFVPRIWVCMFGGEEENENPKIAIVKRILKSLGVGDDMFKHIKEKAEEEQAREEKAKEEKPEEEVSKEDKPKEEKPKEKIAKAKKEETKERKAEGKEEKSREEKVKDKELSRLLYALHLHLWGKKFLIVLDDACESDGWNERLEEENLGPKKWGTHISCGFPKGFGGKVIVTSRNEKLAEKLVGKDNLHHLYPLSNPDSCWSIYCDALNEHMENKRKKEEANYEHLNELNEETLIQPETPLGLPRLSDQNLKTCKDDLMNNTCGVPLAARLMGRIEPQEKEMP